MPDLKLGLNIDPKLNAARLNVLIKALKDALGPLGKDIKMIDAEALKKELGDIERKVREARKKAKPEVDGLADDLAKAAKKGGDAFGNAFKANQIVDAARNISQAVNELSRPFVELDKQVQNIGTLGVKGFKEFTGLALDLSKRVPDSAANIAAGVYDAISAGVTGTNDQIIGFVETASKVAVAGLADTQAAVNGLTSILNAYGKGVDQAGQVSNVFFAGINLGKTTFNELNASLSNVVPAASSAGIAFEEVIAFIAQMTALGVPTAQATTQIRQAIVELQKPGADLAAVMASVGLNASNVGQALKDKGLIAVLQQVAGGAEMAGKSLTQVFSSTEAASAALLVTGQNAQRAIDTFTGVQTMAASGVAETAYAVAAEGIEVKTKIILNKIQASIASVFDKVGAGFLSVTNAAAQLAPTLVSLSQVKTLIPQSAITKISGLISGNLVPSLAKIAPMLFTTTAAGATSFVSLGTAAKIAWTAITGPVGLVIAAIGAVVGLIGLWLTKTKEGQGVFKRLQTAVTMLWASIQPVMESLGSLLASIGSLIFEAIITPFQIVYDVWSMVLTVIGDFIADMIGAKDAGEVFALVMDKINLVLLAAKANINGMIAAFKAIKEGMGDVLKKMLAGDIVGATIAAAELGKNAGKAYTKGIRDTIDEKAVEVMQKALTEAGDLKLKIDAQVEIENIVGNFEKAQTQVDALKAKLQDAKSSGAGSSVTKQLENELLAAQSRADGLAQTLAQKVPSSVTGMKQVIDSAGRLRTVYDVNIDQVKELTEANKTAFGDQIQQRQKAFANGLQAQANVIASNETELKKLSNQIVAGTKAGKNVEGLTKRYAELSDETNAARTALRKSFDDASAAGMVTETNIKQVAKALGISVDQARSLVQTQKQLTDESKRTVQSVDQLAKAFDEAKKKASDTVSQNISALAQMKLNGEQGTESYRKLYAETRKAARERDRHLKTEAAYTKAFAEQKAIVPFDQAKKIIDEKAKQLEYDTKLFDISQEQSRLLANREQNSKDELVAGQQRLNAARELYKITKNSLSGITLSVDEKRSAEQMIVDAQRAVGEAESQVGLLSLRVGLDEEALQRELRSTEIENLKIELGIGIAKDEDIKAALQRELAFVQEAQAKLAADDEKGKAELLRQALDLENQILEIDSKLYAEQQKLLDDRVMRERAKRDKIFEAEQRLNDRLRAIQEKSYSKAIDKAEQSRLDKLERVHETEIMSDEEYERQKTSIAEEAAKAREILAQRLSGSQRFDENAKAIADLISQKEDLERKLKDPFLDQDSADAIIMRKRLDDLADAITERGDVVKSAFDELGSGIAEGITGAFAGDPEAMKDALRNSLAVIAGYLEKQAQAFVLGLVLSEGTLQYLSAMPFPLNILSVPIITATVRGAVSALMNPILSTILSFAGGGRVDSPTVALIGDASTGNRNTEWVTRDSDIQDIVSMTVAALKKDDERRHQEQMAILREIRETQAVIRGSDIVIAHGRASAQTKSRIRTGKKIR